MYFTFAILYNDNNIVLTISAKIHPTDQMSIALVYPFALSIISGARYHLVATYSVKSPTWFCTGSTILKILKMMVNAFLLSSVSNNLRRKHYELVNEIKYLAIVKSQIFKSQLALTNKFDGFRSRCNTFAEWMYLRPLSTWYNK